jgi:hypothetical protein
MAFFLDCCRFIPASNGTGSFVVASAAGGYQTPASANAVNGATYRYRAESADLTQWEVGTGVYTAATATLTRSTILFNSSGGTSPINFTAVPQVAIVCLAEDVSSFPSNAGAQSFTTAQQDQLRQNIGITCGGGYANIVASSVGTVNTLTITADAVALFNSSGNLFGATAVSLTLNMAASGANGLDTGSVTTSGYNYFVIYDPTTGTTASLASLSATAPTLPSGYTYKRRIGWFSYSAGIIPFVQRNSSFCFSTQRTVVTGGSGLTSFSLSGFAPPTATKIRGFMVSNNNNVGVFDDSQQPLIVVNAAPANACTWQWEMVPLNSSILIFYSSSSSGGEAGVTGWDDNI